MANTPEPCSKCKHLYYSTLSKNDPKDKAKCLLGKPIGSKDCLHFEDVAFLGTQETEYVICPGCKEKARLIRVEMSPEFINELISFYNGLCIYCGSNLLLSVYKKREEHNG